MGSGHNCTLDGQLVIGARMVFRPHSSIPIYLSQGACILQRRRTRRLRKF